LVRDRPSRIWVPLLGDVGQIRLAWQDRFHSHRFHTCASREAVRVTIGAQGRHMALQRRLRRRQRLVDGGDGHAHRIVIGVGSPIPSRPSMALSPGLGLCPTTTVPFGESVGVSWERFTANPGVLEVLAQLFPWQAEDPASRVDKYRSVPSI
jgi:hypothetical protein